MVIQGIHSDGGLWRVGVVRFSPLIAAMREVRATRRVEHGKLCRL